MSDFSRRGFLKFMGYGTAGLGLGLSLCPLGKSKSVWAADVEVQAAGDAWNWDEWEFYYPGKYDAADTKVLNEFKAELDRINNRGDIDTKDLIGGKLSGVPGIGGGGPGAGTVTYDSMIEMANQCGLGDSPLFTDRDYAKNKKYGDLIAVPLWSSLEIMPALPKSKGIGDYLVVSDLCHTMNYYKPFYEGDTLSVVTDGQYLVDTTPAAGSHYRTFVVKGWGRIFNQKGELVAEGASMTNESYRRHKDPTKRNKSGAHSWESPDWWIRPPRMYTDHDYDVMKEFWKNETSRGATPLYWDDVKIGDMPTPTLTGPVIGGDGGELMSELSQDVIDTPKNVMDPEIFPKMVKNEQGIYVLPESMQKKAASAGRMGSPPEGGDGPPMGMEGDAGAPPDGGGMGRGGSSEPDANQQIKNQDGRGLFWNVMAHRWIAGLLTTGWANKVGSRGSEEI